MGKGRLRLSVALPIILTAAVVAFMGVNQAANATVETPKVVWGDTKCLRCHTDLATIKKMQEKKDDPTFCQAAYERIAKGEGPKSSASEHWNGVYGKK